MDLDRSISAEQSLNDFFQCHICCQRLEDPHLCPHCSKPCCLKCYKHWLMHEQPNCPFCRAHLLAHELVRCRWLEEIIDQMEALTSPGRGGRREGDERDWCPTHKERLSVFCKTCMRCICSNCALFGGQHLGHDFTQVDEIYQQHLQALVSQANRLRQHLLDIARRAKKVDKAMERVLVEKDKHERLTVIAVENIRKRLQKGLEDRVRQLSEAREKMNDDGENISHYLVELEKKINGSCKSEVIMQAFTAKQMRVPFLQDVNEQELSRMTHFTNEIVPGYEPKSFKLEKFSRARQRGEVMYSAPLRVGGLTWRLKVYPDGCNNVGRGKYLSVFLELKEGFTKSSTYEYRIQLLWQGGRDASKDLVREHASEFALGESWGYNKFCKLDYLVQDGYLSPVSDSLHFRFGVRCLTYHQQCKDMGLYVHSLERQRSQMTRRIRHLEQKLRLEVSRNRSRGQAPEEIQSQSSAMATGIRRGSHELEEEVPLTSPSHHTEEEEEQQHSERVSDPPSTKKPGPRRGEEAAAGSSVSARSTEIRELSQSVQDMPGSGQLWREETLVERPSSQDTTEYIGPRETDTHGQTWHSPHQRSQSADSINSYQPNTKDLDSDRRGREHLWGSIDPQTPWNDEFVYDTADTSQHSPTAAPDIAFFGDHPPSSSSKLSFMPDLSQNRQSQSPTEHLRRANDPQYSASHVDDSQYGHSGTSGSPRDSRGYLSQHCTQEEELVGNIAPPPQQRKRNVGHTHQTSKYKNCNRLTSEPYHAPGLRSSVLAALSQDIPPPPLTQYMDSQARQRQSMFGDANDRHAATQLCEDVPGGRRQHRRAKAQHNRSQEKLLAVAHSTSSSSLNRLRI